MARALKSTTNQMLVDKWVAACPKKKCKARLQNRCRRRYQECNIALTYVRGRMPSCGDLNQISGKDWSPSWECLSWQIDYFALGKCQFRHSLLQCSVNDLFKFTFQIKARICLKRVPSKRSWHKEDVTSRVVSRANQIKGCPVDTVTGPTEMHSPLSASGHLEESPKVKSRKKDAI